MGKETVYRAKALEDDKWVKGFYYIDDIGDKKHIIKPLGDYPVEVDPDTLCEYTGVCDRDHSMIFEHDIVMDGYRVKWNPEGYWDLDDLTYQALHEYAGHNRFRIDGNVFDDPEILKNKTP